MLAITLPEFGDEDVLTPADVNTPTADELGADEVLVRVAAAGVNRADLMQRQGYYPPPPGASELPGLEISGTIEAAGLDVSEWAPGDEVCALLAGGGYAEYAVVPADQVLPVPRGLDLVTAAGLPEVTATVWSNVFMTADLRPDELLLVHGGSSGIGTMAIQLAKTCGARVAVTAGSAEKLEACGALGADVLINYREDDFVAATQEEGGANVILDVMGAKYLERNIAALAASGRLVVIGMQGGTRAELDLSKLLAKRAQVTATSLRSRPREEKAAIVRAVRENVWPLIESGHVRPIIHSTHPLAAAADAHRELAASQHIGKVLLTV